MADTEGVPEPNSDQIMVASTCKRVAASLEESSANTDVSLTSTSTQPHVTSTIEPTIIQAAISSANATSTSRCMPNHTKLTQAVGTEFITTPTMTSKPGHVSTQMTPTMTSKPGHVSTQMTQSISSPAMTSKPGHVSTQMTHSISSPAVVTSIAPSSSVLMNVIQAIHEVRNSNPSTTCMPNFPSTRTTQSTVSSIAPMTSTEPGAKDSTLSMINRRSPSVTLAKNNSASVSIATLPSLHTISINLHQNQLQDKEHSVTEDCITPLSMSGVANTTSQYNPTCTTNTSIVTSQDNPSCTINTTTGTSTSVLATPPAPHTNARQIVIITPTVEELMRDRRNLVCTVTGCGKVFSTPPALRMHLNKTHKIYENPEERDIFTNTRGVMTPAVNKQYYCPIENCRRSTERNKPFPKLSLLKQHYVGIHAEKTFLCSRCPAKFGMDKLRTKHEETCGVMYQCTCTAQYKTRGALVSHAKYQRHPLPVNFALRPIRQHQKELQRQQELYQKQQQKLQRCQEKQLVKNLVKRMEEQRQQGFVNQLRKGPAPILPKPSAGMPVCQPSYTYKPFPIALAIAKPSRTIATQTPAVKRKRGPNKKPNKMCSKSLLNKDYQHVQSLQHTQSLQQTRPVVQSTSSQYGEMMHERYHQDNEVTNMETQTSQGISQSTHTFTQTQGDVIVRNALLLANIETQTSHAPRLVQSSTQYSNYAATAETQTAGHRNLSLDHHSSSLFDLDSISVDIQDRVASHPAVQTQTSVASLSSSDAQTDNWLSAFYRTHSSPIPTHSPDGSLMTQPSDVPTQTDLSFLEDMFGLSHSETQTMNSLASFMTESSSTQTPQGTPIRQQQSTEVQTGMACFVKPTSYNIPQGTSTQTHMANPPMSLSTSTCTSSLQSTEAQTHMERLSRSQSLNTSQGISTQTHNVSQMSIETSTETSTLQSTEVQTQMTDFPGPTSLNISQGTSTHQQSIEVQTHMADFSIPSFNISQGTSTQQSIEVQTHMAGLIEPMSLNSSHTQTSFADLCLGGVLLAESQNQTTDHQVPFRLDDSLSSSHRQTQTGGLTGHQSTQTAAEKDLEAALSLLNRYTQTSQSERGTHSLQRSNDSLDSDLEFTSMHTQTMEDVLAVLDNDYHSASVQTDFEAFTGEESSFGVTTGDRVSPNNSGVAVQTDTLDLSTLQELDFYSNANSSSQT